MARIKIVNETEAQDKVKEIYDGIKSKFGVVPNAVKIFSINPEFLTMQDNIFNNLIMSDKTGIPRKLKEMIALVVSKINDCDYCISAHSRFLRTLGMPDGQIRNLIVDYNFADLDEKDIGVLDVAEKITLNAQTVTDEDIETLREVGLKDEDILEVVVIASYFNFINRVIDSLKVEKDLQ
ncbi:MAG: carboxymuconolactone decarboxylase family protein [Candidatus Brocadiales bacterium]